jgi:glucose dehydrogenase
MKVWMGLMAAALAAQTPRGDWTTYGHNPQGWRYSELAQISAAKVASLRPEWIFQSGVTGKFEATPLVPAESCT